MKTKKTALKVAVVAVALVALVAFRPEFAKAIRVDDGGNSNESDLTKKNVDALDELFFDGRMLDITYTVRSRCGADEHKTDTTLYSQQSRKVVTAFKVTVEDLAPESDCEGRAQDVVVSTKINLANQLDDKSLELEDQDISVDPDVVFSFPPVRAYMDAAGYSNNSDRDNGNAAGTVGTKLPTKVAVTVVDYAAQYHCQLWKRDGARKDGFDGTGNTLDEARQSAANGCASTNNPNCMTWALDPNHTTCDVQFQGVEKVVEYDSNSLPNGASVTSWGCTLYKQDGSRDDGFQGSGKTEQEARAEASSKCKNTNNPRCDTYAGDSKHTACTPAMRYEMPKPVAVWTCTLWKKDGARKDGFKGSGNTEMEARRASISGCNSTNNPNCEAYAMDPNHTQCTMEIAQAQ